MLRAIRLSVQFPIHIPGVELGPELGHGAHSVVYRAHYQGVPCAVKVPRVRGQWTRWVYREAVALARVRDAGLPLVLEVGEVNGLPYLVMELVEGETLAERLSRGPLAAAEVVALGWRLISTLRSVHDAGLIHRDVKPRNLVFEAEGKVRLLDFGFATSSERASLLEPAGTPAYAAPEQMDAPARIDGRADLYSAGRVLFECIAGHLPPRLVGPEGQLAIDEALMQRDAGPFGGVISGLLQEARDLRYSDARAVLADLDRLRRGLPAQGPEHYEVGQRTGPMVGRKAELARITKAASAASAGGGTVILVQGARGSGKSRLLAAAAAEWQSERRGHAIQVHCRDGDPPLATPRRILEHFAGGTRGTSEAERREIERALRHAAEGPLASVASLIAPSLKHLFDTNDFEPTGAPSAFPEGAAELLVRLAREAGPLFILVDDLQWMDPASREVLARLAHRAIHIPLCLLMASRATPVAAPVLDRFRNLDGPTLFIDLPALTEHHAAALVAGHLGVSSVDPSWTQRIFALTDGTPLGILEVLGAFLDVGALRPRDGSWHLDANRAERVALPSGARVMLGRRVVELPAATLQVLHIAAVVGTAFKDELVAEVVGISPADLEYGLADARRAGLVQPADAGSHRFVHDSLRELLIGEIRDEERRRIHQRLAMALDRRGSTELEDLCATALHYAAGEVSESPIRAYESARAAADAALGRFDNETTIRFLALASTAAGASGIKLDASYFRCLGEAQLRIGALEESLASLEMALAHVADRRRRATVLGRMAWVHQSNAQPERAWHALDQAFTALGARMPIESAGSALSTLSKLAWRSTAGVTKVSLPGGAPDLEVSALLCELHYQNARLGLEYNKPVRLLQSSIQAYGISRVLERSRALARSTAVYGFIQTAIGRGDAGARQLDIAQQIAEDVGDPITKAFCVQLRSVAACFAGDFTKALGHIEECLDERGHWLEVNEYCHDAANADLIEAVRGRPAHGWAWIQRAIDRVRRSDQSSPAFIDLVVHRARACLASRARDVEIEAWLAEQIAISVGPGRPREGFCWLLSWGSRVRVFTERGDLGPDFEALVRAFEAEGHKPKTAHPALAEYYIAVAHARAHQCLRAPKHARSTSLRALRRAFADLAAAAKLPLYKAHRVVIEAYVAWLSGEVPRAERLLAEADHQGIREVAPWVSYAVARARAHMLREAGNADSARDQALYAERLAREYGAEVRARWIREELDIEASEPPPGTTTHSSGLRSSSHARRQLAALLHVVRAGTRDLAPEQQAVAILDELIRDVDADRGYLWFQPDLGMPAHLMVGRTRDGETTFGTDPSHESLLRSVRESGTIDPPGAELDATERGEGHRIIAAPLALQGRAVGAFCVERTGSAPGFGREDWDLLAVLAEQVPVALEVGRLLAERNQLQATLQQAQKMEAVGQLAGGVAHDFNNMLLAIQTAVDSLGRRGHGADVATELDVISEATGRAAELTSKLLGFSRHNPVPLAPCDLNKVISGIEPMLRRLTGDRVAVRLQLGGDLHTVKTERASLEQAIVNLAVNARDAMPEGGSLTIATENVSLDASALRRGAQSTGDHALIAVTDTGQGMDEEIMTRVFEPFFTTKGANRGTGLGLATVYAFVKNCGGHIEVESQVGDGTTFRIYLPRSERIQVLEQARPARSTPPPAGAETILVVDDEELVAKSIRRMLESGGYEVLVAHDAGRACELAEARRRDISLVILDMIMPDVSGSELGRRLHELELPAKLLYVSGYSPDAAELPVHRFGDDGFLEKPFSMNDLLGQVRRLLDSG